MIAHYENLIRKHKTTGVLVDANLLLLLLVGSFRQDQISKFKRTTMFTVDDFELLVNLLNRFDKILTTPNILTEVSNLAGQFSGQYKQDVFAIFKSYISKSVELIVASSSASTQREFIKFGLPDAVSITLAKNHLVLTAELPLANYLQTSGLDVINFNHLRQF